MTTTNSILDSVKKVLGIDAAYTPFDTDIIMHINSAFSTLNQLGVGPINGFMIDDNAATWSELIATDMRLNNVKTYVFLRVKVLFDPPSTSFGLEAIQKQILELEWRLNVTVETLGVSEGNVLDGGAP